MYPYDIGYVNKLCDQGFVGGVRSLVNIKRVVLRLFRSGRKRENKNGWKQRGGSMVAAPKSCLSHPLSASTPIITQLCQEFLASAILWHTFLYIFSEINSPIHPIPSCHIGLRVPNCYRSISTYLEVPQRTSKYPEVPQSTSKYLKTQEITQCTPKYLEIPLST